MKKDHTNFFDKVYTIVSRIPKGRVATYGQIALIIGSPNSSRIVGYAMHSAPPDRNLPCHRVVNREGRMAPGNIFGGEKIQKELLKKEGVTFLKNGCINMEKHLWKYNIEEDSMQEDN
ncbi:MAG: O-6-methylguanine methyltransferase [Anaerocolumna sp.]|jgi:methylated-DNA-protein-cysteine methyltransferase-like protein|nr:O-6-methylguanine methyltransferase [Anaerocolumna sp.]